MGSCDVFVREHNLVGETDKCVTFLRFLSGFLGHKYSEYISSSRFTSFLLAVTANLAIFANSKKNLRSKKAFFPNVFPHYFPKQYRELAEEYCVLPHHPWLKDPPVIRK